MVCTRGTAGIFKKRKRGKKPSGNPLLPANQRPRQRKALSCGCEWAVSCNEQMPDGKHPSVWYKVTKV